MRTTVDRAAAFAFAACVLWATGAGPAVAGPLAPESQRLTRAKDFIAEEQWSRAVEELRAAARDPREPSRDEALFWLAHSLNQVGDSAAALAALNQLEQSYRSSRWVKPARSLRIEIAVHLGRSDVLWVTALPPPPPAPALPPTPAQPLAPPAPPAPTNPSTPAGAPTPVWIPEHYHPDLDLRIQALRHLMRTDADKVIPMLKEIALEAGNADSASRAVFVLAQSDRPQARETVLQVARTGPEPVRVAAVRQIGLFGGPDAATVLLRVYPTGDIAVKRQVVQSLGELRARDPLLSIATSEADVDLRSRAIMMLGRAGGANELRLLYVKASSSAKRPIILSLFNARGEDELIQIAQHERDSALRREVLVQLRLLGTPKAQAYLQTVGQQR